GDFLLVKTVRDELFRRMLEEVSRVVQEKEKQKEAPAVPLEYLRNRVMPVNDRTAFQALMQEMVEAGLLVRQADKLTMPGKDVQAASPEQESLSKEIEKILDGTTCLEIEEIAKQIKRPVKEVKGALEQLAKSSRAAIVDYEFASSAAALAKAHQVLARLWQ